jgi:hypothetical protein
MALADGAHAGFVAKVEDLIDLARHLTQHAGVLIFDAQFEGFDRQHGLEMYVV